MQLGGSSKCSFLVADFFVFLGKVMPRLVRLPGFLMHPPGAPGDTG